MSTRIASMCLCFCIKGFVALVNFSYWSLFLLAIENASLYCSLTEEPKPGLLT